MDRVGFDIPRCARYITACTRSSFRLTIPAQGFAPRPPKPEGRNMGRSGSNVRKKTVCIPVRFEPIEADMVRSKALDAGVPASEFLRSAALGRKTRSAVDSQIINELRRMGGMLKDQFNKSGGQYSEESAAALREITAAISRIDYSRN